ncbi:MAG: PhoH family protein [Bacillota bacterium]|nr:PhoH family protein [Bacillota bacterium]
MDEMIISLGDENTVGAVLGQRDTNLNLLEQRLPVGILVRGNEVHLTGDEKSKTLARHVFEHLKTLAGAQVEINENVINYAIASAEKGGDNVAATLTGNVYTTPKGKQIKPRTMGQKKYVDALFNNDIVFAIGPAGTGKTYLAVVMAVLALKKKEVRRIVLTRPAVEAGEKLGFLPGDLQDKVDPYLRPLYDGLYDIMGSDAANKLMEKGVIEVAPLAYMRGRTLDDAFIILDEAQNTTSQQMKMFLTRIGFGSKAVITGDITQIDLAPGEGSGLVHAQKVLQNIKGIEFSYLSHLDVVRHPLVQKIINAYEREERNEKTQ